MRAQGIPEPQVLKEIESWRRSGWEPRTEFSRAMIAAYAARQSGAPESVVDGITRPWLERHGARTVGHAFAALSRASDELSRRRFEAEAAKRRP